MTADISSSEPYELTAQKYGVAISWDKGRRPVDVDLQGVIVNNKGSIIDAVYYNNLKASKGITHSGDNVDGAWEGLDETIWVPLSKLPEDVKMIIFVVAARSGGHLRDVQNGVIHVLEMTKSNEVARFRMEKSEEEVDVVCTMVKEEGGWVSNAQGWVLKVLDLPAEDGQHFIDILEPTIGNIIRAEIPNAPRRMKVAFAMEKAAVLDLPQVEKMPTITAGLGWDAVGKGVDLDVSAVLFNAKCDVVDAVYFGNLNSMGLSHSGDNLTGAGDGDDEQLVCEMDKVPPKVTQIIFVINIFTKGQTFERVRNPYVRIMDASGDEMARYTLNEAKSETGLMVGRLNREGGGRWGFQALGKFCRGNTFKDSLPQMTAVARTAPKTLQAQETFTEPAAGGSRASASAPPRQKKDGCSVQ